MQRNERSSSRLHSDSRLQSCRVRNQSQWLRTVMSARQAGVAWSRPGDSRMLITSSVLRTCAHHGLGSSNLH